MFNDKYGLTKAVLEGRKTMTRRFIKAPRTMEGKDVYGFSVVKYPRTGVPVEVMALDTDGAQINNILPKFKVGEVVAVAQSYKDAGIDQSMEITYTKWVKSIQKYRAPRTLKFTKNCAKDDFGWENKMYVKADLMPHQIRITNVRVERLQDISDEDCLREGISQKSSFPKKKSLPFYFDGGKHSWDNSFSTPRAAFADLINRLSGKGTWESNPWVFVYEFELVK